MEMKPRLIVALDQDTVRRALYFLDKWGQRVRFIKIGPGLFAQGGRALLSELHGGGWKVFLDLKLHDIPNTVAKAVRALSEEAAWAITLHTSGGAAMMEAASLAREDGKTLLFGVTVLTSMDDRSWQEVHPGCPMNAALLKRAEVAKNSGMDGIVCSPGDLSLFGRERFGSLLKIVPGIRPSAYERADDQKRAATPRFAAKGGADYLVVGRPITQAHDPDKAIDAILKDLEQ